MAKWIAVKKKDHNEAVALASEVPSLRDIVAELKSQLIRVQSELNALAENPDNVSYMTKDTYAYLCGELGLSEPRGLVDAVLALKADAQKWRGGHKSAWELGEFWFKAIDETSWGAMVKDAELGALVRKMPDGYRLYHHKEWRIEVNVASEHERAYGEWHSTPEEAFHTVLALKETE